MDKKEVIEILRETVTEEGRDPEDSDYEKIEAAGFKVEEVDREGGEDQGSEYYVVLGLTKDGETTYVKCDAAYYASYEGTEWSGGKVYEVTKKKVTVEQWAKV